MEKIETTYPEHMNGNVNILMSRFTDLEDDCNAEVRRYARQPREIDFPEPEMEEFDSEETITPIME